MTRFFNKFKEIIISFFIVVFIILSSPFWILFLIIKTIKDYYKYKKSLYYKDTKEKYSWMCGESEHVVFYNDVKKENLPIDFYRFKALKMTGYGYFVYKDFLILCDYDSDIFFYDNDRKDWFVNDERDCVRLDLAVNDEIEKVNKFLGSDVCKQAVIFVDSDVYLKAEERTYDNIKFLKYSNGDKISALRGGLVAE